MTWVQKFARSDKERIEDNIRRLESLRSTVHDLGYFAIASNSGGFTVLQGLLDDGIVKGRPKVLSKLDEALIGENNQKIALDNPLGFQQIMKEAEELIIREIGKESRELKAIEREEDDSNGNAQ